MSRFLHRWLLLAAALFVTGSALAGEPNVRSAHALVIDESTGEVLLEKDAETAAPIASITKLMTAMVVLDARLDPDEPVRVDEADMDSLKHTKRGLPPGAVLSRGNLLELALIASDNHAAAALARTYPGGLDGFRVAVQRKIVELGLKDTRIDEPTGLSPANQASAADLAAVVRAAAAYPEIERIASSASHTTVVNGRRWAVRNTNPLVGKPGWDILLSKTGFTNEAGSCLVMRARAAGRTLIVVLMGAVRGAQRAADATRVVRWVSGEPADVVEPARPALRKRHGRNAGRALADCQRAGRECRPSSATASRTV
ncbi:MAG: D-alanyl-D-alanine carboxypeptidase family protein [Betaproteobacteria bacterium]